MTRTGWRPARWVGPSCVAIAGVLGVTALAIAGADSHELSAPAASLAAAPSTIPPAAAATPPPALLPGTAPAASTPSSTAAVTRPAALPGDPPDTTTTLPPSPLAALLGEQASAVPALPSAIAPPVRLRIDALSVDVPVRAVGLEHDGQLEIPDETEVGWYRLGATPGAPGASVIAGHVNWHHVDGPFARLRELEPGASVTVTRSDTSTRTYQVVERQQYPKDGLPAERIWTHTGPETLVLITCGGAFNPEIRRFRDNIVVYAVPIA
jgi:hypothetical protein